MTDRELLTLAAKAARINVLRDPNDDLRDCTGADPEMNIYALPRWNPLTDDGDALRLAVKLNLDIWFGFYDSDIAVFVGGKWDGAPEALHESFEKPDKATAATRRAIVRAAAEIGRGMT